MGGRNMRIENTNKKVRRKASTHHLLSIEIKWSNVKINKALERFKQLHKTLGLQW